VSALRPSPQYPFLQKLLWLVAAISVVALMIKGFFPMTGPLISPNFTAGFVFMSLMADGLVAWVWCLVTYNKWKRNIILGKLVWLLNLWPDNMS
jgi:hypothetical protein